MKDFIQHIKTRLEQPLPGLQAQLKMAPPARGTKDLVVPDAARKSAVLVLLYPHNDEPHICFMKRADDGHVHSGQISFPGGKMEKEDKDFYHTALREAWEEVGILKENVEIIAKLSDLYIPISNFVIYPVLAHSLQRPDFVLDSKEVARLIEVPLNLFEAEGICAIRTIEQRTKWGHYKTEAPSYKIGEDVIWGATSMIVSELLAV